MVSIRTLAAMTVLFATACGVDYDVDYLPGEPVPSEPNPWIDLEPGALPDTLLAVALAEPLAETNDTDHWGLSGRIAVIDLRGNILLDLNLPTEPTATAHRALTALPGGRLAVAVETWTWHDGDRVDIALEPFLLDLADELIEPLPDWHQPTESTVRLTSSGEQVFSWSETPPCAEASPPLRELDLAGALVAEHALADILPNELRDAGLHPFALDGSPDGLLLGLSDFGCDGASHSYLVSWSPRDGSGWWSQIPDATWVAHGARTAQGSALTLEREATAHRYRLTGTHHDLGTVPQRFVDARPGPVLDASTGTVVLIGEREDGADSLAVLSEGREVWSIDALRSGLSYEDVRILDAVVIE